MFNKNRMTNKIMFKVSIGLQFQPKSKEYSFFNEYKNTNLNLVKMLNEIIDY